MPSKFEPCGLGQMISLRYGTIPIVRSTGGLADTVVDVTEHTSKGNGFVFREYTRAALLEAVQRAVRFYEARRGSKSVVQRGMSADLSWKASARQYAALYEKARGRLGAASGGRRQEARAISAACPRASHAPGEWPRRLPA